MRLGTMARSSAKASAGMSAIVGIVVAASWHVSCPAMSPRVVNSARALHDDLPSADEIFASCVKAVGGQEAVDKIKTLHVVSTMKMMGQEMNMDQSWSRDGGRLVRMTMPMGEMLMGTDGKTAWMKGPMGYVLATHEQASQLKGQAGMFMAMLDPKSFARNDIGKLEVVGREPFNEIDCYKLHYVSNDGKDGDVYFDAATGLPVGFEQQAPNPRGGKNLLKLSDWKEVEGVKFFHTMTMVMPGDGPVMPGPKPDRANPSTGEINVTKLEVNTLGADVFELPAEVKKLADSSPRDPQLGGEIKLEDLTADQQREAAQMIEGIKQTPGTARIKQMLQPLESSLQMMPPERQKMMRYVIQELKKELSVRGG